MWPTAAGSSWLAYDGMSNDCARLSATADVVLQGWGQQGMLPSMLSVLCVLAYNEHLAVHHGGHSPASMGPTGHLAKKVRMPDRHDRAWHVLGCAATRRGAALMLGCDALAFQPGTPHGASDMLGKCAGCVDLTGFSMPGLTDVLGVLGYRPGNPLARQVCWVC